MNPETEKEIELQRLDLERERSRFERQGVVLRYLAILGAIATFAWGGFQYFHGINIERDKQRQQQAAAASVQKISASQPFLERQLRLFEEATQTAAFLATVPDSPERPKKRERFEQIYWGGIGVGGARSRRVCDGAVS